MKFQHNASWENFERVFNSKTNIKHGWQQIIDFHKEINDKPYWASLRNLDVETEQSDIQAWLEQLLKASPIPENLQAIWIGIVKIEHEGKEVYAIYLNGSDSYDENDIDWAAEPTYSPENRYAILGILNEVDEIIKVDKENFSFLDWILPLAYCALTFDEIIRSKLKKGFSINKIFVTVGHDSGDYKEITPIS